MEKYCSIVIPAHNEEMRIEKTLQAYTKLFKNAEIIVVLNGCIDNTKNVVKKFDVKILEFKDRLGKGGAIIEGFKVAKGKILAFTDADGSTPPEEMMKVIMYAEKYGAAIGSRWLKDSKIIRKQSLYRRFLSRVFNLLVRLLFGLRFKDTQCGCKAFKRELIEKTIDKLKVKNYAFDVELLFEMKKLGINVVEIPISWKNMKGSKLRIKDILEMLISLIKIKLKYIKQNT